MALKIDKDNAIESKSSSESIPRKKMTSEKGALEVIQESLDFD